jgi:hypothetical protein
MLDYDIYKTKYNISPDYNIKNIRMRNFANWSENDTFHLFAIPGKDNFEGIKYNLDVLK